MSFEPEHGLSPIIGARQAKRMRLTVELLRNPDASDRTISQTVRACRKTVANARIALKLRDAGKEP